MSVSQHVARKLTSSRTIRTLPPLFSRSILSIPPGAELEAQNTLSTLPPEGPEELLGVPSKTPDPTSTVLQSLLTKTQRRALRKKEKKEQLAKFIASQEIGTPEPLVPEPPNPVPPADPVADSAEWTAEKWEKDNWGSDTLAPHPRTSNSSEQVLQQLKDLLQKDRPFRAPQSPVAKGSDPATFGSVFIPKSAVLAGEQYLPLGYKRAIEGVIEPSDITNFTMQDLKSPSEHRPIAKLAHGLDRVVFNPGVHWLQDPRSRVYNFSPWLQNIPKVQDFAFNRVSGFIQSSKDDDLQTLVKQVGAKYSGSTSSLTGILGQIYFMLSADRRLNYRGLSSEFTHDTSTFTPGQRLPVSVVLNYRDGAYSTDSDPKEPGWSEKNVLTWMGTMLEKFLTVPEEEFSTLLRHFPPSPTHDTRREAYRYARYDKFVMRSQLDCHDSRLPGTGVFDIKTRAALPIRLDMMNLEENSGYLIRTLTGRYESFEREYYDLIRSAFLKYSFQARIGNMDGIFVTYHNTSRVFGFQYVTLEDMDECLYGNKLAGPHIFENCLKLMQAISDEITHHFPEQSVSCLWNTETKGVEPVLNVFIQPRHWDGSSKSKPIVQLDISTVNYIKHLPILPYFAATHIGKKPWSIHYRIRTSELPPSKIRDNLQRARDAQTNYWNLPTGVNVSEMEGRWHAMNYGSKEDGSKEVPFPQQMFKNPDPSIKFLRRLAILGREDLEKLELEEAGKPKVVLGRPEGESGAGGSAQWRKEEAREEADAETKTEIEQEPERLSGMEGAEGAEVEVKVEKGVEGDGGGDDPAEAGVGLGSQQEASGQKEPIQLEEILKMDFHSVTPFPRTTTDAEPPATPTEIPSEESVDPTSSPAAPNGEQQQKSSD